nr:MAG TPA: Cas system-associated protein [Caudoviricetes sp.]
MRQSLESPFPGPLCLGTGCNYSPLLAICQR